MGVYHSMIGEVSERDPSKSLQECTAYVDSLGPLVVKVAYEPLPPYTGDGGPASDGAGAAT